jgi:haloalkane dehalogenase
VGNPILFLHGVPTSSYVWRKIIPYLAPLGRCIALDLIGFGDSEKPDITYTIFDHIRYVEQFIETLQLKNVTIVMHGWGSIVGFQYAMQHEKNCRGLVFYEAFLRSLNDDDLSLPFQEQLATFEDQIDLPDLLMSDGGFIDAIMPKPITRQLSEDELDHYQAPFRKQGSAKPILNYIKDLIQSDRREALNSLIYNYTEQLTDSRLPKLMLYSIPGFITTIATVMWAKKTLPNLEVVEIGEELHLGQESYPELMGEVMSAWLQSVEQS